jgi:GNAT superfamily N-acetyltransferase
MPLPLPRTAVVADIPELVRIINAAYRVEDFFIEGNRTSAPELAAMMARPMGAFLVVETPASPTLAAGVYLELRGRALYFGMLSVDPALQRSGHAGRLIGAIEARAREAGCNALEIEVVNLREELPAFYLRHGFIVTGEKPFHSAEKLKQPAHMVLMEKQLPR